MTKTRNDRNTKFRDSLYPNLLMACAASKCRESDIAIRPRMVIKENPKLLLKQDEHWQQTFVMRWNPEISSYKVADFEHAMEECYDDDFYFDWSIWDYRKVHSGDRFFMLKVGNGNTGIVMSGTIIGKPYKDEDWSGRGRDVRYVRMIPDCMIHPDRNPIVTTRQLDEVLPGVIWNEGHSGVLLNDEQAAKFNELWQKQSL